MREWRLVCFVQAGECGQPVVLPRLFSSTSIQVNRWTFEEEKARELSSNFARELSLRVFFSLQRRRRNKTEGSVWDRLLEGS